ncbi:response regulator transcription factor [Streptomyces roseirectus]|uniref:response regulator transcription factor n=1 Tax=Streptomyces roseirectus TaxID=2768066 RepID=UPI001FE8CE9B|nr:response regulator transcription factor [Streptomyces roseirectus]
MSGLAGEGPGRQGYAAQRVATGRAALDAYERADLVLMDLDLPDLDGLGVCRRIRAGSAVPVIAVTARGSEPDRVPGPQAGADDYVVKPYGLREPVARVDVSARRVTPDGRPVGLTREEFDLVHLLAARPDTVVPRKRIMREVWGDAWSRRTIDTHIGNIRGTLGSPGWVVTVRGVGFPLGRQGGESGAASER